MKYEVKKIIYKGKQIIILIIPYIFYLYKIACFYCQFRMITQNYYEFHAPLFETNSYTCKIFQQQQGTIKMAIVKTGVLSFCRFSLMAVLVIVKKLSILIALILLQY